MKYVFVYRDGMQVPEFYRVLLRGLGVRDADIIVLTRTTRFRRIIIPDQAFNVWYWSSDMFRQTYNAISDYYKKHVDVPHYDKIYVSRGAMPLRRPFGEQQLENIFRKNGFAIIYPETLPLPEQIALMSHCQVLAGAAGTALHLSLFMPNGGSVIWLKRNSDPRNDNAGLQHMLCSSFDMSLYLIEGSIEQRPTGHFTNCPQIMGVNKYVRAFLDDHGFKYTASDIAFDAAEWARYESARAEYESTSGTEATSKLKKRFIKILACFVIGRVNRNRFRKWLQNKLQ